MRTESFIGLALLLFSFSTGAAETSKKKPKEKALKSNPGGAGQRWMCEKLADASCDIAKHCEPDKSLRYCKTLHKRCDEVTDAVSKNATEDDVGVCAQAVSALTCKEARFGNELGVSFDMKPMTACSTVTTEWQGWQASASPKGAEKQGTPAE